MDTEIKIEIESVDALRNMGFTGLEAQLLESNMRNNWYEAVAGVRAAYRQVLDAEYNVRKNDNEIGKEELRLRKDVLMETLIRLATINEKDAALYVRATYTTTAARVARAKEIIDGMTSVEVIAPYTEINEVQTHYIPPDGLDGVKTLTLQRQIPFLKEIIRVDNNSTAPLISDYLKSKRRLDLT